jgi:hypothetical protein|eukprot:COSAG01_NODE_132_length_24759_cov_13.862298_22_plen_46_part_00
MQELRPPRSSKNENILVGHFRRCQVLDPAQSIVLDASRDSFRRHN